MIEVKRAPTADSRTCDSSKVTEKQLLKSSKMHINDVVRAGEFFKCKIDEQFDYHDDDKITDINGFYKNFKTDFVEHDWLDRHYITTRHHLNNANGIPVTVDLVDVMEYISDCVMAGLARSGKVRPVSIDPEALMKAFNNTVALLADNVVISDK